MNRVVIDTNIIVSSAISKKGKPAEIMDLCFSGFLHVFYNTIIFNKYKKVLSYKRLNISNEIQNDILNAITEIGKLIDPIASTMHLPDETDRIFYDTARASGAILITGNIQHFPSESFIMTPADFINKMNNPK